MDRKTILTIAVAALGYFVDVFDILLFTLVRVPSLKELGIEGEAALTLGVQLINAQNLGLLLGGIAWGVLGDRRGRLSVLLGSILTYSVANIANGFVTSIEAYTVWRFIAGFGLAGELGAGITLASELLPQRLRGYGSTIIASFGFCGAFAAAAAAAYLGWRGAYFLGGGLGLVLLLMRIGVTDSAMFARTKAAADVSRGNLLKLLTSFSALKRIFLVSVIGVPIWFVVGIVLTFSPEFATAMGIEDIPSQSLTVVCFYVGYVTGGVSSGLLSQWVQSRRTSILISLLFTAAALALYVTVGGMSRTAYLVTLGLLGLGGGYWTMFVQVAAEQFGTNYRSTVATSIPNLVRGANILMTMAFRALIPIFAVLGAGVAVGVTVIGLALVALALIPETFHRDLDYNETL